MPIDSALTKYGAYKPAVCTSTTRPASPYTGQTIYETDTGAFLVYYGATTGWRPPWNQPWGFISNTTSTGLNFATSSGSYTDVGLSSTFTAVANRWYRITSNFGISKESMGAFGVRIVDASNSTVLQAGRSDDGVQSLTYELIVSLVTPPTDFGGGSTTVKVQARASGGSGNIYVYAIEGSKPNIMVEDIGPKTSSAPIS